MDTNVDWINEFKKQEKALAEAFLSSARVNAYLTAHTAAADKAVRELARLCELPSNLALLALGGYGRRELFPHSDIDLMVLLPADPDEALTAKLEAFIMKLWELGLTVGHSIRTLPIALEESAKDITVQTALLEARYLWGDQNLFENLQKAYWLQMDAAAFFRAKHLELAQRHHKYEDTPYALEPNVKESPGGLRDLQVLFWCAKAANFGDGAEDMIKLGHLTEEEAEQLREVDHELKRIRIYLHLLRNRHEDRLIFDIQTALAEAAGYKNTEHQLASEALMRRYYLTAKSVSQLSKILRQMLEEKLFAEPNLDVTPIDETFISYGYTLDITDSKALKRDPNAILRGFYILESTPSLKRLGSTFLRALWHARKLINTKFREDPKNKATFMGIIKMKEGVSHTLLDLNQWGILGLFIPPFQHIVGQMQHDLFHAYTVDQHTMRVVRNIRYFTRSEYAHEYPLCTRLMESMPKNWRLVFAALFHDIGKGRGGNHEEVGADIVRQYCEHFGLSNKETEFITFLVREHLTMSLVAQKKDLSDPEVIKEFAQLVGTEKRLNALYLLTVSDIRATSPKVWNNWKAQLLEDLYRQTLPLVQSKEMLSTDDWVEERQNDARMKIMAAGVSEKACNKFWRRLSLVHFIRNSADAIAWQTIELHDHMTDDSAVVRARQLRREGGLEVLVYVPDQPLLFARILAFLQKKRFSVMDARIYTTRDEKALDTFIVADNGDRDPEVLIREIEEGLTDWLNHHQPLPTTKPARLSRRSRMFPIRPLVRIVADESGKSYLLSITCTDRIGLLYDIAQVLNRYNVNLQTAKIMTMGERVEDVFLIDGPILGDITQTVALEKELLEVLTPTV